MDSRSTILFRPIEAADYDAVARITQQAYLAAGNFQSADHPYLQYILNVRQRAEQAQVWVAETESGAVAGAVTLARQGEPFGDVAIAGELEVRVLVVDPERQRQGVGEQMLRAVFDLAAATPGVDAISLCTGQTWASAHALYRRAGFDRVPQRDRRSEHPNENGERTLWQVYRRPVRAQDSRGAEGTAREHVDWTLKK